MGTLLASQACTAQRNQVHLCPDDLGSPCPWDAHSPACETFRQEGAHAGRCCLYGSLLRLPLFLVLLSSMGTALGRAAHPIVAVLSLRPRRGARRGGAGRRCGSRLPALPHNVLIPLERVPDDRGDEDRECNRVAVLRFIRGGVCLDLRMEVGVEPAGDGYGFDRHAWDTDLHACLPPVGVGRPGACEGRSTR